MAICSTCDQEMKDKVGCNLKRYSGEKKDRVPNNLEDICHDCYAPRGTLHHPGCYMERCPDCGGQLITCGCCGDEDEG